MAANLRAELQFALALIGRMETQGSALRWRQGNETNQLTCDVEGFTVLIGEFGVVQIRDAEGCSLLQFSAAAFGRSGSADVLARLEALRRRARTAAVRMTEPLDATDQARLAQLVTRLKPTARREAPPPFARGWTAAAARLSGYLPRPRALPQGGVAQDGVDVRMASAPA
jgi:hypothetical protein